MKHYEVRRQDKYVEDKAWMEEIMRRGQVINLALCGEDGWPYLLPMSYGWKDGTIYLHGAAEGKKIDMLAANPRVCFNVALDIEVVRNPNPSQYTMKYRSVTGLGQVVTLTDLEDKNKAMRALMQHYEGPYEDMGPALLKIWVAKIVIESMTGKSSVWPRP